MRLKTATKTVNNPTPRGDSDGSRARAQPARQGRARCFRPFPVRRAQPPMRSHTLGCVGRLRHTDELPSGCPLRDCKRRKRVQTTRRSIQTMDPFLNFSDETGRKGFSAEHDGFPRIYTSSGVQTKGALLAQSSLNTFRCALSTKIIAEPCCSRENRVVSSSEQEKCKHALGCCKTFMFTAL